MEHEKPLFNPYNIPDTDLEYDRPSYKGVHWLWWVFWFFVCWPVLLLVAICHMDKVETLEKKNAYRVKRKNQLYELERINAHAR